MRGLNKILSVSLDPFVLDIKDQVKLLNDFEAPSNLIERSFYQFKIQFKLVPLYKRLLNNTIGFFAFFYFILRAIGGTKNDQSRGSRQKKLAVFPYKNYHYPDIIPGEVRSEFFIQEIDFMSDFVLKQKDLKLIFKILSEYPFQFYFISKCVSKILFYRYIIQKFNPDSILSCSEYSFTSSITTLFCRENKVEHINVMHGEKFFLIKDSFFEFDRFYVWDNFYKELFIKLRAEPTQFRIGTFSHLKMNLSQNQEVYNYTYYLAREPEELLEKIKITLQKLDDRKRICIRFHPRYSSEESVRNIFDGFAIENPVSVSLDQSLSNTKNVISLYSSCLIQAYFNNKSIIIDDVNHDFEKIKILKESEYIIFSKPHKLLSGLINNN